MGQVGCSSSKSELKWHSAGNAVQLQPFNTIIESFIIAISLGKTNVSYRNFAFPFPSQIHNNFNHAFHLDMSLHNPINISKSQFTKVFFLCSHCFFLLFCPILFFTIDYHFYSMYPLAAPQTFRFSSPYFYHSQPPVLA